MINLNKRDAGSCGHSTHVVVVPPHLDVALVTPGVSPAVLHQPVVMVGVRVIAVAHCQHSVVQVRGAAFGLVVDTITVELEAVVAGVDSDADWSHAGHSRLQSRLVTLFNVNEAVISSADVIGLERARVPIVFGCVGVALLIRITLLKRIKLLYLPLCQCLQFVQYMQRRSP